MNDERMNRRKRRRRKKRIIHAVKGLLLLLVFAGLGISMAWLLKEYGSDVSGRQTFSSSFDKESCPDSLLEMAEKNPETVEFVENYSKEKDKSHVIDLSKEVKKGEIPLFMQWDKRWGYEIYGDDMLAVTGCGPTCLSMVICGLSGRTDWTPLKVAQMAQENGYYVSGSGSSWSLMSEGAGQLGLTVHTVRYEEETIKESLKNHQPIICIMGPGDFTTTGHFIVLSSLDKSGKVQVRDPFRKANSKAWELSDLMGQIRNLWSYSYE